MLKWFVILFIYTNFAQKLALFTFSLMQKQIKSIVDDDSQLSITFMSVKVQQPNSEKKA